MKFVTLCVLAISFILAGCRATPRFQKATIQIHEPNPGDAMEPSLHFGRFVALDQTLFNLIAFAYQVEPAQISGGDNLREKTFNVFADMPPDASASQLPELVRSLLEDRFKIKTHRETKEQDVFVLTVASGGPKFKEALADASDPGKPPGFPYAILLRNSMARWTQVLSQLVKKPVLDRTNLKAKYSVNLGLNLEGDPVEEARREIPAQLGLNLEPRKETLQMLVIDKAETLPTEEKP